MFKKTGNFLSLFILPTVFVSGLFFTTSKPIKKKDKKEGSDAVSSPFHLVTKQQEIWADSVLKTMSLKEQIGQLFMVAAYSNRDENHAKKIDVLIEKHHIGGLIFFQGGPLRQARLTNRFQQKSKIPLMISIDGEWGLAMRLDSTLKYPRQMMLGAIRDNALIEQMGEDIAEQCKTIGVHVNLAPVLDINNNPKNPVIGSRSFGEQKENVADKGIAYIKGMQNKGVMANGKHFPGHGDTDKDSHKTLPTVTASKQRLNQLELFPFKKAFDYNLASVMVAHLYVPALDSTTNVATTLSKNVVQNMLKKELDFKGLVFTDALNMKGVSNYSSPGELDLKALLAGNDVLLFSENVPLAIQKIEQAIEKGKVSKKEIAKRCRKILLAKKWLFKSANTRVDQTPSLLDSLNKTAYKAHIRKLTQASITLLKNQNNLIPLKRLDTLNIASVAIGSKKVNAFQKTISLYKNATFFTHASIESKAIQDKLLDQIQAHNLVIISLHNTNERPYKNYGISKATLQFIEKIALQKPVILVSHANPYALNKIKNLEAFKGLIVGYDNADITQEYTAQAIFGGTFIKGQLPVSVGRFSAGSGVVIDKPTRFGYTSPEHMGVSATDMALIDSIAIDGVKKKAYPGCQILVAKKGQVIYNKSFGYHTYDSLRAVKNHHLYDIASITKIASTTLSLMHLTNTGEFDVDIPMRYYIPEIVQQSPYADLFFREILSHQAGLVPWIPFYAKTTKKNGGPDPLYYQHQFSSDFDIRVADNLYLSHGYLDTIFERIITTPLLSKKKV